MSIIERCDGASTKPPVAGNVLAPDDRGRGTAADGIAGRRTGERAGRTSIRRSSAARARATSSATTVSTSRSVVSIDDRVVGRRAAATRPGRCRARRGASSAACTSSTATVAGRRRLVALAAAGPLVVARGRGTPSPGASGNTTVPMSRPSTTRRRARATHARWLRHEHRPHRRDARRPSTPRAVTSGPRISALTSRPSSVRHAVLDR